MQTHRMKRHNRIIICLVLILCMGCCVAGCGKEIAAPSYDDEIEPADEISMFAIITNLDDVNGKITLRAVDYDTEITLSYNGGVDVQDKYGDILAMSQVELGSVVDAVYDANRDKLVSLHISKNEKVKKLEEISGAIIDNVENTVRIDGETYRLSSNAAAFSDNKEIAVNEICSEDQIAIWLYNDTVCSIYVELGHGYVRLSDYASYIGGMVEIGYDVIVPVTEDMLLTVREGEYTLRIAKGDDVGTKTVQVIKNQEIDVSLADIAIEPKQTGSVLFKITPADAAVYIDGKRVNTEGAIDLVYGKHKIYITAEGYQSYSASFNVNYAYKIKEYKLTDENATTEKNSTASNDSTESSTSTTAQATEGVEEKTTEKTTEKSTETKDIENAAGEKTENKVTVLTPDGAGVYFDGEYLGIAPISFTKVTGSHIITLSKIGCLSKSYTVTFTDDGKDETLKYDELVSISSLIN